MDSDDFDDAFVLRYKINRYPAKYFRKLRAEGAKNKVIAQMFGISELKVRKVINKWPDEKLITVYDYDLVPSRGHHCIYDEELYDEEGHSFGYLDYQLNLEHEYHKGRC
ncbi:MAG TPA: hypothetical protein PLS88_04430 [Rectinema sp.]|jgi:hypothetical protein|nr:hypothetical protein [Spirochaetota bacterium]HNV36703.1 hypothetical protein [Rectinema sp.]HOC27860.1 hypothetical protein [Rectinema sp.]HOU06624.1 hypothetical protein [Rectinema sp.]HPN92501.1 hypothetical protein [Rectinema sp.]